MTDNPNDREQESTPASSLRSKRKLHIVIFIAVAAALIAGGWWYFRYVSYGQ